jgi:Predicted dithiol-disulfide isomerase involved in polyketide biosynthesis
MILHCLFYAKDPLPGRLEGPWMPMRDNVAMDKRPLDITLVSDVACPWCAIGLASIEQALSHLGNEVEPTIHVEPYELNPDMAPEGADTQAYLMAKYGRTPEQLAQARARIVERGAEVGFKFGERKHVWNTFNAHRMLHWAGLEGKAVELKRALLRAYHAEGRNPGAPEVLVELAREVGLDPVRAKQVAEGDAFAPEVREREREWMQRGVSGVPFVVVNGKYALEGAHPPAEFEQAFRQIAAEG